MTQTQRIGLGLLIIGEGLMAVAHDPWLWWASGSIFAGYLMLVSNDLAKHFVFWLVLAPVATWMWVRDRFAAKQATGEE